MTRLSVNVNKVATLRNARGEGIPDVQKFATDCEALGAQGITVHPRPDERHITRRDVVLLKPIITTEFNIEGYPSEEYLQLVLANKPTQATLVPDAADVLTTNEGWDVERHADFLRGVVKRLKDDGIRVSIFVAADPRQIRAAAAVAPFIVASQTAADCGLGVNAGHDLNSHNLRFFAESMPKLDEVSIGHAIISEALYDGIATVIKRYRDCLA